MAKKIKLKNFTKGEIQDYLSLTPALQNKKIPISMVKMLYQKTGGNPFFVNQFIKTLYEGKMLEIDPRTGWKWDIHRIAGMQVTDNIVDLLAGKITRLQKDTRKVLTVCACIGNRFHLELLSDILGKSVDSVLDCLGEAIDRCDDVVGRENPHNAVGIASV